MDKPTFIYDPKKNLRYEIHYRDEQEKPCSKKDAVVRTIHVYYPDGQKKEITESINSISSHPVTEYDDYKYPILEDTEENRQKAKEARERLEILANLFWLEHSKNS